MNPQQVRELIERSKPEELDAHQRRAVFDHWMQLGGLLQNPHLNPQQRQSLDEEDRRVYRYLSHFPL